MILECLYIYCPKTSPTPAVGVVLPDIVLKTVLLLKADGVVLLLAAVDSVAVVLLLVAAGSEAGVKLEVAAGSEVVAVPEPSEDVLSGFV